MSDDKKLGMGEIIGGVIYLILLFLACATLLSEFKSPEPYEAIIKLVCYLIIGFPFVGGFYAAVFLKRKNDK